MLPPASLTGKVNVTSDVFGKDYIRSTVGNLACGSVFKTYDSLARLCVTIALDSP